MKCPDVVREVEHSPHWHVVMAGNIIAAQGMCSGYRSPECICHRIPGAKGQVRMSIAPGPNPISNQSLYLCPVHQPRLHELRKRIHGYA